MKPAIKFGLSGGAFLSILLFAGYSLEWYKTSIDYAWTVLNTIILILAIYLGVRETRKLRSESAISYREATLQGIKIVMIIAVIHSSSIYFYFTANQSRYAEYKKYTIEKNIDAMKKAEYNEALINDYIAFVEKSFTPFNLAKDNLIIILLMGLLFALITASILRKKGDQIPEIKK